MPSVAIRLALLAIAFSVGVIPAVCAQAWKVLHQSGNLVSYLFRKTGLQMSLPSSERRFQNTSKINRGASRYWHWPPASQTPYGFIDRGFVSFHLCWPFVYNSFLATCICEMSGASPDFNCRKERAYECYLRKKYLASERVGGKARIVAVFY